MKITQEKKIILELTEDEMECIIDSLCQINQQLGQKGLVDHLELWELWENLQSL